ncbi:MAG: RNA polymerase sigma-70 factor [Bacteroidales bacterium]|jgi:RNA polymerase sigma-70 factor (ECF subfamily)|nr:RNA polymerase sigma-70 factor [Bacteroidales bacterium]
MDDPILISLLNNSNIEAYKQLFVKYYSPLCEYASQFVGDEDAEDIVQDFMLFIWEIRRDLVIENSLKSYLFVVIKHRCLNHIKKQRFHQQVHEWIYEKLQDQFEDPDRYMINELAEQIQKAVAELPKNYRETFTLSRFGDQTNVKIAKQLGISIKTVEYRISQSLKILRTKLKEYLPLVLF